MFDGGWETQVVVEDIHEIVSLGDVPDRDVKRQHLRRHVGASGQTLTTIDTDEKDDVAEGPLNRQT